MTLRGVVVDLSGLRDRGPGFKTRSRPLSFTKAVTNFRTLHVVKSYESLGDQNSMMGKERNNLFFHKKFMKKRGLYKKLEEIDN